MRRPSRRAVWLSAVAGAALVVAAVVATAPGAGSPDGRAGARASATPSSSPVPVVLPGRPGDSPSTVMSDEIKAPDGTVYNLLDVYFMRMMITHHTQALEMVVLAPGRASHPQVLAVAERIRAAQLPEIGAMRAWLKLRGLGEEDAGHSHADMPGMQSPEKIKQLTAASGAEFDRLFVELMSAHHEGAIRMATDVLGAGRNGQVEEMATAIATEQRIEIARMREALAAPR
jgi:uncharacterized protein (DUF305 family)